MTSNIIRHIYCVYIVYQIIWHLSIADEIGVSHEPTVKFWDKRTKLHSYNHIHRKAKFSAREMEMNQIVKTDLNSANTRASEQIFMYKFCESFILRHFNLSECINWFLHANNQNLEMSNVFAQRKLLSLDVQEKDENKTTQNANKTEESEQFKEFLAVLKRKLSKDPQRAMYSLLFLLAVIVAAMKLCGMRMAKNIREEPQDFESHVQYMNVYDIIKMKKAYLPQKLLQWNRKVRRKLRKKKTIQRAPLIEQDLGDPPSDNTDEERVIYADVCDF